MTKTHHDRQRGPTGGAPEPSFAEHVCLSLIVQGVAHGWALGTMLAAQGEIGRIWSLSRPLTYRAIEGLVDKALVTRQGAVSGHGRDRSVLAPTTHGRRVTKRWLETPVRHLRDVRTELLVKLSLRKRAGLTNESLLNAQNELFARAIEMLTSTDADDDIVDVWRRENARAVRRFLDHALHPVDPPLSKNKPEIRLSARNQLRGTITAVQHGEVMSTVKALLGDGQPVTAAITKDAAEDLDLAPGDTVVVIIKSTEVMLGKN
jgi:PadR family transcriptional regulator AphA